MSLAQERKEYYLHQNQNAEANVINGIPLYHYFPKFGSIIPAIPKGYQMLLTAGSGIGKTTSWMGLFLYTFYKLRKNFTNIKLKLVVALLEDPKELFVDRLYCMMYNELYGMRVTLFELWSLKNEKLRPEVIEKLERVKEEVEWILSDIELVDNIYNSTGLYKWAKTVSCKLGTHHNKIMTFTHDDGTTEDKEVYSHYEPYDKDLQVLFVVDNLNNIAQEKWDGKSLSQHECINMWSRTYCRLQITKHWKWSVLNILQQSADVEEQQFDARGGSVIEKNKPSLKNLGNSKEVQRDHFLILGVFAPNRYGAKMYPNENGYNIERLKDHFRSITILKSNFSESSIEVPLYFDGSCCQMRELLSPIEMINGNIYDKLDAINNKNK